MLKLATVRNIHDILPIPDWMRDTEWEVTEKMNGSSMTVYHKDGIVGVCSRNLDLLDDGSSNFWKTTHALNLPMALAEIHSEIGLDIAIQGELCGPDINGNQYLLSNHQFYVFDIFDITSDKYLLPEEREQFMEDWLPNVSHVPIIFQDQLLGHEADQELLLAMADGESKITEHVAREGLVFKDVYSPRSFKVMSNKWLLKTCQ